MTTSASGVLIGEMLAGALAVWLGQNIVFMEQDYNGSISSGEHPVHGIFRSKISDLDGYVATMLLSIVRESLPAPSDVTAIALRLRERPCLELASVGLAERLGNRCEVAGWPRLLPVVAVSLRFHEAMVYVVLLVFFVVVVPAVTNPVPVSVIECTHRFGIMFVVGMSRMRVFRPVLYESVLLGIAGSIVDNAVGWTVATYFTCAGTYLHGFGAGLCMMSGLPDVVHPVVNAERGVVPSVAVFVIAGLAVLYPAAKAVQLRSIRAIRGLPVATRVPPRNMGDSRLPVFVLLALRNLLRNPRHTALMAAGTAFGIVGFVFILGFFDGFFGQAVESFTRYLTGHIQVRCRGFRKDCTPEFTIDDAVLLL